MMELPYLPWRGKPCPIAEVELEHAGKRVRTLAYVDTGATFSVFQADFCEELELHLRSGKRIDITVGDGGIIHVYLHKVKIKIDNLETEADIGFSERLGTGINILGREGILDNYMVCFDGKNKKILWHDG